MDGELAAFENDITTLCAEHMQSHWKDKDYRACVSLEPKGSKYFIKFDDPTTLWPEFSTQSYIHDYAKRHHDKHGPRIPQALHYFEAQGEAFLVWNTSSLGTNPLQTSPRGRQRLSIGFRRFHLLPKMSWVLWEVVASAIASSRTI